MAKRVLILSDTLGSENSELGAVLMKNFIYSLARNADKPAAVMLMHSGVRLACEGSESLDDLKLLIEQGIAVKACGTCLDYLGLKEALVVGEVGTMPASVEALLGADDIVTLT